METEVVGAAHSIYLGYAPQKLDPSNNSFTHSGGGGMV